MNLGFEHQYPDSFPDISTRVCHRDLESENCGMLHKLDQWFCVDNGVLKQKYRHICRPDMTCQCENHFEKYIDLGVCVQYRPSVLKSSLIFLKRRKQNFYMICKKP